MCDLKTREVLLQGKVHDGLYRLQHSAAKNTGSQVTNPHCFSVVKSTPLAVWHARLGHPCLATLKTALTHCNVPMMDNKSIDCVSCHLGKAHKFPFPCSNTFYTAPLQLVVLDV